MFRHIQIQAEDYRDVSWLILLNRECGCNNTKVGPLSSVRMLHDVSILHGLCGFAPKFASNFQPKLSEHLMVILVV